MTEPNNIGLLGSGRRIVLDDGAVTEIVSAPRGAEAVNEWHRHRDPLTGDRGFESCSLQRGVWNLGPCCDLQKLAGAHSAM
jgi:hypothetical protein